MKRFAPFLLLLAAACSSTDSPAPHKESEPPPAATTDAPHEPQVARPKTPPQEAWVHLEDKPVIDLAERASDEAIGNWITALGGKDDGEARQNLARQGVRVMDRLREAAKGAASNAAAAAELLAVFEPRFEPAYLIDKSHEYTLTSDGTKLLTWKWVNPSWNLSLIDASSGKELWTCTLNPDWRLEVQRPQPAEAQGNYVVGRLLEGNEVEASLADGTVTRAERRAETARDGVIPPPDCTFAVFPGGVRLAWDSAGLFVRDPQRSGDVWLRMTVHPNAKLQDVSWTESHFFALHNRGLNTYGRHNFKLLQVRPVPEGASFLFVSTGGRNIVLGGKDWNSFAVLKGMPPVAVGRVPANRDTMTAMTSDPHGRWIATADAEGQIHIFLAETLEQVAQFDGGMKVGQLEFACDGSVLLAYEPGGIRDPLVPRDLKAFRLVDTKPAK